MAMPTVAPMPRRVPGNLDEDLAAAEVPLLIRDDDDEVSDTTMTMAVNVTEFVTPQHLCIMVQGEDTEGTEAIEAMEAPRILDTSAYTAMGSYKGLTTLRSARSLRIRRWA